MKKNWTYKKLGAVAKIVGGSTPKTSEPANWAGSNMWVTPAELDGSKYFGKTQRTISDKAASKLQLLPIGTVLFSSRAPIGKVAITTVPMYCNQGFKNVICGDNLYNEYVYWCLTYNIPLLQSLGVGATFKELSKSAMSDFSIPIPPLSIQRSIVAELDLLHSVISKKKEQLRELDNLAQSLFYQMFGDPITNPMGWEIKKLGEVGIVKIGPFGSLLHKEDYITGGIPIVNPVHMKDGYIKPDLDFTVTQEKIDGLSSYVLRTNDFIFARRGDIGRCAIVREQDNGFICGTGSLFVRFKDKVEPIYTFYVSQSPSFINVLKEQAKGATMLNINCGIVEKLHIPLPPLSLQQSFAAKVSAIEEQKQAITQSIKETEALLAQRMDTYFA